MFRKDLVTGEVVRVSTGAGGEQANDASTSASVSADGRYVVFVSGATNLVAGDTNASPDVFRKDLATGTIERPSQSGNGTLSNGVSFERVISADGSFVIFASDATNLVAGDVNNQIDLFKKDLATGAIELVSRANDAAHSQGNGGSFGARISADGRYIVFESGSTNLVDNDTNDSFDVFRKELATGDIVRVSTASDGTQGNGGGTGAQISADGRFVVFESNSDELVAGDVNQVPDIFLKDLVTGKIELVSVAGNAAKTQGNNGSFGAQLSPDGRYVLFSSFASNFQAGDTDNAADVFRKDLIPGKLVCLSTSLREVQGKVEGDGKSSAATISADGRYVFFSSAATNLVVGDTNTLFDIFRKDLLTGDVLRLSTASDGAQSQGSTGDHPAMGSADGASSSSRVVPTTSSLATRTECLTSSGKTSRRAKFRASRPRATPLRSKGTERAAR